MRKFFTIVCFFILCQLQIFGQNCSGGGAPSMVTLDLTGLLANGGAGTTGNSIGTVCFGSQMAVVGDIWNGLTIATSNGSYCNEAAIRVGDVSGGTGGWAYTFFTAANSGPCGTASFAFEDYNAPGGTNIFNTDASGCIHYQIYDILDDSGLDFTFTAGSITFYGCPVGQVLPIEILSLQAEQMKNFNLVSWTTAQEVNNNVQMVERSHNGKSNWEVIGKVSGTNSNKEVTYEVVDENPMNTSFYRIHAIDFDGREQFSKIVVVRREGRSGIINSIQPNPTINFIEVELQPENSGDINYSVMDVTGKLVKSIALYAKDGELNTHKIDMSDLQNGLYIISIRGGGLLQNTKIIKE